MIDYLEDSCTGRITEFPHTLRGGMTLTKTSGAGVCLAGSCPGAVSGCEVLKCDKNHFYVRDPNYSNNVNVYDEDGYKVKTISINDIDF